MPSRWMLSSQFTSSVKVRQAHGSLWPKPVASSDVFPSSGFLLLDATLSIQQAGLNQGALLAPGTLPFLWSKQRLKAVSSSEEKAAV